MKGDKTILWLLVTSLCLLAASPGLYEQGKIEKERGNVDQALLLWMEAAAQSEPDPRVGFEFIRTVTEDKRKEYYEKASELFYWGLEATEMTNEVVHILKVDLEYLSPLISRREYRSLSAKLDDKDVSYFSDIRTFWDEKRISVVGDYNERLLEHWERIAYVKEYYLTGRNQTLDARGEVYLRLGPPTRKRAGVLDYDTGFTEFLLSNRLSDGGGGASPDAMVDAMNYMNTANTIRDYHQYPSYEVWSYPTFANRGRNLVYIFGNDGGSQRMRMMKSLDDFIPAGAFSASNRNSGVSMAIIPSMNDAPPVAGEEATDVSLEVDQVNMRQQERIPPAVILQIMYHRELAAFDPFFASRYDEMINHFQGLSSRLSGSIARQFQHINTARLLEVQTRAPEEYSSNLSAIMDMPASLYAYQFYNEQMEPYWRIYKDVNYSEAIYYDQLRRLNNLQEVDYAGFQLISAIRSFNRDGGLVRTVIDTAQTRENPVSGFDDGFIVLPPHASVYELRAQHELHASNSDEAIGISPESTLPGKLKAIGHSRAELSETARAEGFTVSDLLLGYLQDGSDTEAVLAHNRVIPEQSTLVFFYEAYNLPENEDGLYEYTLTYEIRKDRNLLSRLFGGSGAGPTISIENVHDRPVFAQELEIVAENLDQGDYKLRLEFNDGAGNRLATVEKNFSIE
ncbi:MAG: GWxTD domain-containing protein [Balneolaceae bacterium]